MTATEVTTHLRLSDEDTAQVSLPGQLLFDSANQPTELGLHLVGIDVGWLRKALQGEADDFLAKRSILVQLANGDQIKSTIEMVRNTSFDSAGTVIVRCLLGRTESATATVLVTGSWVLWLTNVKLRMGDAKSLTPAPPGAAEHLGGWKIDRIPLLVAGREWILRDELFGERKRHHQREVHAPLISATLSTPIVPGDTPESVCYIADVIAALLTLALARSVCASKVEQVDADGGVVWWSVRNVFAHAFSRRGFPAVDNWTFGVIRGFVERAYPIVTCDRAWWLPTLDMFMQVHANPCLQVKAMLLNVIADRIAAKLGNLGDEAEIDATLNARMERPEFLQAIHTLFAGQSPRWTEERTRRLIGTVKGWNARPSFAEGIRRACHAVRLNPPPTGLLGARHRLMHVGELHPPDMTLVEYWTELEAIVLLLILRMLDYEGYVYAAKFGAREIRLSDYLEPTVAPNDASFAVGDRCE